MPDRARRLLVTAIAVAAAAHASAQAPPGADVPGGSVQAASATVLMAIPGGHLEAPLRGLWAPAARAERRPAVLLLHGCGGLYRRTGEVSARHAEMLELMREQGWHVLLLDSFSSRGVREICTVRAGARTVSAAERKRDALAALEWLAARGDVDAGRIAIVGWSHGGSTTLNAVNAADPEVRAAPRPALATAFYPGCRVPLRDGWQPLVPTVIHIGERDDWTPAAPCIELGRAAAGLELHLYPGAHHGFDDPANPVRLRTDVPGGVRPGAGVTVGGEPAARAAAYRRLLERMRAALD